MKKYSVWSDEEVKRLFKIVEEFKHSGKSLLSAFSAYAKESDRKRNSVRNYYYTELSEMIENKERQTSLEIDISLHQITTAKNFSDDETEKIVTEILKLTTNGLSVRKACLNLSNNDISEMVRIQNKYRNVLLTNPSLVETCTKKLKENGIEVKNPISKQPFGKNIISMPTQAKNSLTDSEITSLFLGLVKLVKKCALEEAELKIKQEGLNANDNFRKMIVKLSQTETENKKLQEKYKLIEKEKDNLSFEVKHLKSEVASLMKDNMELTKNKKMDSYEEYMKNINKPKQKKIKNTK